MFGIKVDKSLKACSSWLYAIQHADSVFMMLRIIYTECDMLEHWPELHARGTKKQSDI